MPGTAGLSSLIDNSKLLPKEVTWRQGHLEGRWGEAGVCAGGVSNANTRIWDPSALAKPSYV